MATPYIRQLGTEIEDVGTGDVVVPWPSLTRADDVLLILVGTELTVEGVSDVTLADAQGFEEVPGSAVRNNSSTGSGDSSHFAFWCRADQATMDANAGAMPSPTITGGVSYKQILPVLIRGGRVVASPWNAVATGARTNNGSYTLPAVTTTVDDCLILGITTSGTATAVSGQTNATLFDLRERFDSTIAGGAAGALHLCSGELTTAGSSGTTAVTPATASPATYLTLAFMPPQEEDAPVDETAPVITVVSPSTAAGVGPRSVITIDLTDETGLSAYVLLAVILDPDDPTRVLYEDVIHDGDDFGLHYQNASNTITAISGGYRLTIRRDDGWPGSPRFRYILRDSGGNAGVIA